MILSPKTLFLGDSSNPFKRLLFFERIKRLLFKICLKLTTLSPPWFSSRHWWNSSWLWWKMDSGGRSFPNGGDALLVELRSIQLGIATCYDLDYTNFICKGDCQKAVDLIHNMTNASLHMWLSVTRNLRCLALRDY